MNHNKRLGIPGLFELASFDDQDTQMMRAVKDYVGSGGLRDGKALVAYGNTGCGKSHGAAALLNSLRYHELTHPLNDEERWDEVAAGRAFWLGRRYLSFVPFAHLSFGAERDKLIHDFYQSGPVVIDDFGVEHTSDAILSLIDHVIADREAGRKATIISTNFKPTDLVAHYGDRIASRLAGDWAIVVNVAGPDRR